MTGETETQEVQTETEEEVVQEEFDYEAEFNTMHGGDTPIVEDEPENKEDEVTEEVVEPEVTEKEVVEPKVQESADPYSWIDELPEELKAKAETLKHTAESDQGRVSAYNRRLQSLQYEMDRMKQDASSRPAPAAEVITPVSDEMPESFKQLKEDFPEFADAVDDVRKYDREQFDKIVADRLQPIEDERTQNARDNFISEVSDGAEEIFNTSETGLTWQDVTKSNNFLTWLDQQPPSVRAAAGVRDSQEALYVLERYEDDYQKSVKAQVDTKAEDDKQDEASKADKIKQDRAAKLEAGVAPGSKPAPGESGGEGGDYDAQFDAMWGGKSK